MPETSVERLSHEFFARRVNTRFRARRGKDEVVELELREVTPLRVTGAGGANWTVCESFAARFLGPHGEVLTQRMYPFESGDGECFELFIVPVGQDPAGIIYEAVFNRLIEPKPAA